MPRQWNDSREFVSDLRNCDWRAYFDAERQNERWRDRKEIIRRFVAGNTFRAFHHMRQSPSAVFRLWADDTPFGQRSFYNNFVNLKSGADYDEWLKRFAASLRERWQAEMACEMPLGKSLKLVNLLMKGACVSPHIPTSVFEKLVRCLHVPLDSYSIQAVRNCAECFTSVRPIPKTATMGFVESLSVYDAIQEGMRLLASRAQVPPIAIDILTWNEAHQ